jgi:hypothetical protein
MAGWLKKAPFPRPRHVTLFQQRAQGVEQVEVDISNIPLTHDCHSNNALDK